MVAVLISLLLLPSLSVLGRILLSYMQWGNGILGSSH